MSEIVKLNFKQKREVADMETAIEELKAAANAHHGAISNIIDAQEIVAKEVAEIQSVVNKTVIGA